MRIAVAALCVLALTGSAGAVDTCRGVPMPPKDKQAAPTVYYKDYWVSSAFLAKSCGTPASPRPKGCAYPSPTKEHPDGWTVLIAQDLTLEDLGCVFTYEHAHLPPNFWVDPTVESAETVKKNEIDRRTYARNH